MSDHSELRKLTRLYVSLFGANWFDEFSPELTLIPNFSARAFAAKASPSAVSELIAEHDRISEELSACKEGPGTCGYWRDVASAHLKEIERLKAELSAELQRRWDGNEISAREHDDEVRKLKAEVEALRKERDARHPFNFHEPAIGFTGCVICGVFTDHGGLPCPKMSPAAKAFSMENQRIVPVKPVGGDKP